MAAKTTIIRADIVMLDTLYVSSFFPKYNFNILCIELPQNVTWTDE